MRFPIRVLLLVCLWLLLVQEGLSQPLRIAVASNFAPTLETILPQFRSQHGEAEVIVGASGVLYAQILNGAPVDVFLSADSKRPQQLERAGRTLPGSRQTYASGQLAYWHPYHNLSLADSIQQRQRLAIANPRLAPYGLAARQALKSLSLWEQARPLIVQGNSVAQGFQFVHSGHAPSGLVPVSLLIQAGIELTSDKVEMLDNKRYSPITQQLVRIKGSASPRQAKAFVHWLLSKEKQQWLISQGYSPAEGVQP